MADNVEVLEHTDVQNSEGLSPEIKQQMDLSLGIQPQENNQESGQQAAEQTGIEQAPPAFSFEILKEKFGYENPESVLTEIEALRKLKETPVFEPLKFENEISEKIFHSLQSGKEDELYDYLNQKRNLDKYTQGEVSEDNVDDIIKLGMRIENPVLTTQEVDYMFKKEFNLPKQPVKNDLDEEGEYEEKLSAWQEVVDDIKMGKMIKAKMMQPKLNDAKTKLVLPNIDSSNEDDFLQYKQDLDQQTSLAEETKTAYKAFTSEAIKAKLNFNDEASKVNFDFVFEPDAAGFAETIDMVSDMEKFFSSYKNSDGTPNRQKFLEDIYYGRNRDKVIMEAIKQAKNATIKASLPDNSNNGFNRHLVENQEPSDFDKQMQNSFAPFGRR